MHKLLLQLEYLSYTENFCCRISRNLEVFIHQYEQTKINYFVIFQLSRNYKKIDPVLFNFVPSSPQVPKFQHKKKQNESQFLEPDIYASYYSPVFLQHLTASPAFLQLLCKYDLVKFQYYGLPFCQGISVRPPAISSITATRFTN